MPYHKIHLAHLSNPQIGKLLNGHRIRVKHGHGHEVHLSEEQHKKVMKAHKKGAGSTIQFDPFQIHHHQHLRGTGFLDVVKKGLKQGAKYVGNKGIDMASGYAKNALSNAVGSGVSHQHARHAHHLAHPHMGHGEALFPAGYGESISKRRGRKGRGILGGIAKTLAPMAINAGADFIKSHHLFGQGARGKGRGRRGKGEGILDDIGHYGQMALDFI